MNASTSAEWPHGSGAMAARVRGHDWASTPLGPIGAWPEPLRVTVQTLLACPIPAALAWGPGLVTIANDGFAPLLAGQPDALGRSFADLWGGHGIADVPLAVPGRGSVACDWSAVPVSDTDGAMAGTLYLAIPRGGDRAEERLRASEERQAFLLRLSDALRPLADPAAIQEAATRLLGQALGVTRALYAEFRIEDGREWVVIEREYRTDGSATFIGRHPAEQFASDMAVFRAGRVIVVADAEARVDDEAREVWRALGVRSRVTVPLVKHGRLVAALCIQDRRVRDWTADDVALIRDVANRTWDAVDRARAELALKESEQRLRGFAETSTDTLWIIDAAGTRLEYLSPAYEVMWGQPRATVLADLRRWIAAVHPEDHDRVALALPRVLSGESVAVQYRIIRESDGAVRWIHDSSFPIRGPDGTIERVGGIAQDMTEARQLAERTELLLAELQHRVRNILTVVRSVFERTWQAGGDPADMADHFRGRLDSLARAQVVATRSPAGLVDLEELIRDELLSVRAGDGPGITIGGPDLALSPKAAEAIGLAIHELTTNALKYGALKVPGAKLSIAWTINKEQGDAGILCLTWSEQGVPAIDINPARYGFGSELITEALPYRLGAETALKFGGGGMHCTLKVPLPDPSPAPLTW